VTCEPLDAAKVQTPHFFHTSLHGLPQKNFRSQDNTIPDLLPHAGSQDTDLSCHVPISNKFMLHYVITVHLRDRRTDGRADGSQSQ